MKNLKVMPITALSIQKVLTSQKLSDKQKAEFIHNHSIEIKDVMKSKITKEEFVHIMKNRPLIRFRPLKNSFTKKGDKILLAKSLNIEENKVNGYIDNIIDNNFNIEDVTGENIEKVKTYVYRHGKKDQVVAFLDYELSDAKTVLQRLYKTLDDNSEGLAGYFTRPIHRMSNNTLVKLYNVVDKRLRAGVDAGEYSKEKRDMASQWALVKIYQMQNNSKLIRAYRTYAELK